MSEPSTTAAELIALAERVEGLTGACRETDEAIRYAIGWRAAHGRWYSPEDAALSRRRKIGLLNFQPSQPPGPFTASLDAALGLVPSGWGWGIEAKGGACEAAVFKGPSEQFIKGGFAATPALALTSAALRARAAEIADGNAESSRAEAIRSTQAILNEYRTDLEAAKAELGKGR